MSGVLAEVLAGLPIEATVGGLAFALVVLPWWWRAGRRERRHRETLRRNVADGLDQPPSLHPVVDPDRCIGTAACVPACPEGDVLGVVDGRAVLVDPTRCIGHGECLAACPVEAIELVFGTAKRGIEIPHVRPDFETDVPGVFIAGELGGMGLVRNAVVQGTRAAEAVVRRVREARAGDDEDVLDLVVVGAGPAGLAASLAARAAGLRFQTLEQDTVGGAVYHFPRGKMVITRPVDLPLHGRIRAREISKEELLGTWSEAIEGAGLEIRERVRVSAVRPEGDRLRVVASDGERLARHVLLAIGRRGTPRTLGVPGEESPAVTYALPDPGAHRGERVLVVGGGNSALEAAVRLAEPALGNEVVLSYRGEAFTRATRENRSALADSVDAGRVRVLLRSQVRAIEPGRAHLDVEGVERPLPVSHVLVQAGGILPTGLLREIGVRVDVRFGRAAGPVYPDRPRPGGGDAPGPA